jgi:hypothetical protein
VESDGLRSRHGVPTKLAFVGCGVVRSNRIGHTSFGGTRKIPFSEGIFLCLNRFMISGQSPEDMKERRQRRLPDIHTHDYHHDDESHAGALEETAVRLHLSRKLLTHQVIQETLRPDEPDKSDEQQ